MDIFKGLTPVCSEVFPDGIKYFAGAFTVYKDAYNAKEYIKGMGLMDAFVVAYSNGKRVNVEDARNHENDGN
jgi:N-acetylmuramoyl-L-alanine amidase